MSFETLIIIICAIYVVGYVLRYEINWQWAGFNKIKKWFRKKGCK